MMPARKTPREPRGVYVDRVNGFVRAVDSRGREVHFSTSEDPLHLDMIAQVWEAELDLTDPVQDEATPRRPSTADLRHLRLLP
jgi:hypothetical protein